MGLAKDPFGSPFFSNSHHLILGFLFHINNLELNINTQTLLSPFYPTMTFNILKVTELGVTF
jgi:hypothetical protein